MVASRSDTKRRRRDSSPLDSNSKRTKVHAQRKFAQGVTSLSNLLNVTPVKEKSDKPRNNGLSASPANGLKGSESTEKTSDGGTPGKRALPARGAKKPSIEDMITFLCYRSTTALPPRLAHLNKAPSPEPQAGQSARETARGKLSDRTNKEGDKHNNKKSIKSAVQSAQKAVTAAQALKRKYQEQRIKKTSVSTLAKKVKATPLLRTTRSTANAIASLSSRTISKKAVGKKTDTASSSKKKDSSGKDDQNSRKSSKAPTGKQSTPSKASTTTPSTSGSRGGLRSSKQEPENTSRSSLRTLGSSATLKKKKPGADRRESQQSRIVATSLSDFSSEDDQPLVKKHKPLVQVQKLIKKSIANIGRKMKLEPRRSKRCLSASPMSSTSQKGKRLSTLSSQSPSLSSSTNLQLCPKDDDSKSKTGNKKVVSAPVKEVNGGLPRNLAESQKKEVTLTSKSPNVKMKKGYAMEYVPDSPAQTDPPLETRSRRGSRDLRDVSSSDKTPSSQSALEVMKPSGIEYKKRDSSKSGEQSKKTAVGSPKPVNPKPSSSVKSPAEFSLSAVLKSPPDLRIPPSIKRPLTAVGITNPMAIAAAAAVVCKSSSKPEDRGKPKDSLASKDPGKDKKTDSKRKESNQSKLNTKPKCSKEDDKPVAVQAKSKQGNFSENKAKKDIKIDKAKAVVSIKTKIENSSDEDSKPIISMASSDKKKDKLKLEQSDSMKEVDDDSRAARSSRRSGVKSLSDEDETLAEQSRVGKSTTLCKNSSDEEESKLTPRGRRSTVRSLKKVRSSDDEGLLESSHGTAEAKASSQGSVKASNVEIKTEPDSNVKSKKQNVSRSKSQSSEEEVPSRGSKKSSKKSPQNFDEDSSDSDDSGCNDQSDNASRSASKPSTRSAAKSELFKKSSYRTTRSGKKVSSTDLHNSGSQSKGKQKCEDSDVSSSEVSEPEICRSSRVPKTRSKAVKSLKSRKSTHFDSSDDGTDEDTLKQPSRQSRRRATLSKKTLKSADSSCSLSESSSSQDIDKDDDFDNANSKSKSRRKSAPSESDTKALLRKAKSNRVSSGYNLKNKPPSEDESDEKKKSSLGSNDKQEKIKRRDNAVTRRSRSPRRSSRTNTKVKTSDGKNESSESESSSSESSPSQNRRVLRERREFFSFAEVDPPSDSEEEVLAATKASLEMISQQSPKPSEEPTSAPDKTSSKEPKLKNSESSKSGKKLKCDPAQPKKPFSKKRVKAPSEVQPNLNEELEKTLLSINLSPEMTKSIDKSPDDSVKSALDDVTLSSSNHTASTTATISTSVSTPPSCGSVPSASSKHRKTAQKIPAVSSPAAPEIAPSETAGSTSSQLVLAPFRSSVLGTTVPISTSSNMSVSTKCLLSASKTAKPLLAVPSLAPVTPTVSSISMISASMQQGLFRGASLSGNVMSTAASGGLITTSTLSDGSVISSGLAGVSAALNTSAPILSTSLPAPLPTHIQNAVQAQMTQVPMPSSSVSASLSTPMGLPMSASIPVSMSIPLTNQLGIPMQTSGNVPLTVPMSSTMTLPLQVGSLPSGTSTATPFLLPVQSALGPMLASGQTIIKKDGTNLGGMPNPVGNTSQLMVGMNPLVVNSNRGTFILSTGNTMTMTPSQQQIVPGPLMPSLLSLRLPDKPAGQQTIMANPSLYVPFPFGNPGIIQTQGQVQPQIQTVSGVSTITAMASNIQNTVATNIQNTDATNIQNTIAKNLPNSVSTNIHSALASSMPNPSNFAASVTASAQSITSISSAMTLSQSQGSGSGGTGMKRQLVLATKNGPVSKLILSVGEDGSHVLAAASPNTIPASEGQTLMSVMQPVQSTKSSGQIMNVTMNTNLLPRPSTPNRQSTSLVAPNMSSGSSKGLQPVMSNVTATLAMKPSIVQTPSVSLSSSGQPIISTLTSSQIVTSSNTSLARTLQPSLQMPVSCLPSNIQTTKSGLIGSPNTFSAFKGAPGSTIVLSSAPSNASSSSASLIPHGTVGSAGSPSVSTVFTSSSVTSITKGVVMSVSNFPGDTSNSFTRGTGGSGSVPVSGNVISGLKLEARSKSLSSTKTSTQIAKTSVPSAHLQEPQHASTNVALAASLSKVPGGASGVSVTGTTTIRPVISKSAISTSASLKYMTSGTGKIAHVESPGRIISKPGDVIVTTSSSVNPSTVPVLTSRIPSAPAALAALKSPSGTPSTRAIAKTGSSRKPYSTAASYAVVKTTDSAVPGEMKPTSLPPSHESPSRSLPSTQKSTVVHLSPTPTASSKLAPEIKLSSSPSVGSLNKSLGPVSVHQNVSASDSKRKGSEVELAPTHRTLSILSTAFQGNIMNKDRKISVKRTGTASETSTASSSSEKQSEQVHLAKSGLDSLAEVATSLAERSAEASDKRMPEHSLWTNPAQILGQETLRVPGLPITANVGTNLPTKNDLAKMKSGAVLADAIEKRTHSDIEKVSKGKVNLSVSESEKPSVSGLLASSKADTPRQKVQKWLDDGSKGDVEHKGNCSLLSSGSNCTCDVVEDISNLNSLAEVCVNMERIDSPSKDTKTVKQSKQTTENKRKQESMDASQNAALNSNITGKTPLPLDSHQMKVTWQNAFGVKSPNKGSKPVISVQSKRGGVSDDVIKNQTHVSEVSEKNKRVYEKIDQCPLKASPAKSCGKVQNEKDEVIASGSTEESINQRKLAQRRSILSRAADPAFHKLGASAFSADNESSVYAFEAETDAPPVSKPFRRRSKTLSRSDEEDSASVGSVSNPNAVHVSKDPVFVPIQVEADENSSADGCEKNGVQPVPSQNDNSGVYYIPLGGQEGNEGDVRAVAVRLGKEGPNNRVVMSAKLVNKPPTFKHPSDTSEDGHPTKKYNEHRAKMDSHVAIQSSSTEIDASLSSNQYGSDSKSLSQVAVSDVKGKCKPNQKDTPRSSLVDSSSEDTSSLPHIPSSKDHRESRNSMSPASSRNKSPMSDKASPSTSLSKKKGQDRLNRQSSLDSDNSEKAKSSRRGSKSKSASSSRASPSPSLPSTSSTSSGPSRPSQKSKRAYNGPVPGNISEAPVFHPTEKEFQDPYSYIEKIRPVAEKYGLCRIVAPHSFKPDCNVEDDIRFTADNQYVHKMMDRWGPNAKEMRAIVKYIAQHNIILKHAPLVGGMELDLPRLYTTVQNFGGLMEVMDKKRWVKVAETMRIPKSAQDRASKLDEVYCKCLLPYETLKTSERDNLFEMVEVEWEMRKERRDKRLAASATSPDQLASDAQQEDEEEEEEEEEDDEEDECIVKGRSMPLTTFYRTARNTTHMWFKGSSPSASEVEHEFWRHVRDRNFHICVNAGSVDCSDPPYGFPTRNSPFAKHPWNLKVFSSNSGSVLRSLGSVIGVTVPTLHFGMVFTTCCWYRDPHGLPWIEYLHTGAKKIWYGIPEHGADKFRSAMQEVAPHYVRKKALWLASDTAMIPPNMLTERKVPLCRTVQEPGQFIVVFPKAHTSSVATGYIVSESVSFAPLSWLSTALESFKEMQKCNEPPLFSLDKLIFSIAEDPRSSLHVLNTILPSTMEILEREITYQQELKKKGIKTSERVERKSKLTAKKAKLQKETEDPEVMECDVCSTSLFLSMVVNTEDDAGYCLIHASSYIEQDKLNPSHCKLLYTYSQNELHEFCQNLLDRIEAKSGKKGNFSSNNSDSGSSVSTSTRH